jgi:uncharacterized membrane protein YeiH
MDLLSYLSVGSFVIIDLIAATINAFNGGLLSQRADYYKGNRWTVVGIILLAIFGGIGGGVSRDIILNKIPGAFENPWYLILCITAGIVAIILFRSKAHKYVPLILPFMTSFSLPWYAAIGVQAGINAGLPDIASIALGVIGPTAGRYLIDITAGKSAKQFVRGELFVTTAVLTSIVYLICAKVLNLEIWPATFLAVAFGFTFRVLAQWRGWEEPMPRLSQEELADLPERSTLKEDLEKARANLHPEQSSSENADKKT